MWESRECEQREALLTIKNVGIFNFQGQFFKKD